MTASCDAFGGDEESKWNEEAFTLQRSTIVQNAATTKIDTAGGPIGSACFGATTSRGLRCFARRLVRAPGRRADPKHHSHLDGLAGYLRCLQCYEWGEKKVNKVSVPETQRRQLIDFLKGCRARLTPAQVGLPDTNRRRTPGLRREDVAALAGVSVTWYTWLEQGRDIQVSADVLERICSTLRMSPDER